jgi:hypothetical protein
VQLGGSTAHAGDRSGHDRHRNDGAGDVIDVDR